jgi:NAD-dependent DNA ligase
MIEQLLDKIKKANDAYRLGKPIMSDLQYDILVDELYQLDPNNDFFLNVGHVIQDESRKKKLPIAMASMNKVKSIEEINDWVRLKGINPDTQVVITPKFDGLSLCVNEITDETWTRGDGTYGQKSDEHYKLIGNKLTRLPQPWPLSGNFEYTYGEAMMPKSVFLKKYSTEFANPRNLVAGLLNSKEPSEILKDLNYIKYGGVPTKDCVGCWSTKSELLDDLNAGQEVQVNYHVCSVDELTEDLLVQLFHDWSVEYEIDGVIIEVNWLSEQEKLGRETSSNNPVWARAFKSPKFEQSAESEVIGISWNISKQGLLKPIIHIKPVKLDGVTVSNVTGNNARFVKDMSIGVGAIVKVKRSGMVIPIITDVIKPVDFQLPYISDGKGGEIDYIWNEAGIELVTLYETEEQRFKQTVSFFEILEADNVSEGVIKQLWDARYQSVKDIVSLKKADLEKIDRFGKRKSEIVYNSIQKSIQDVSLSKLQHATGIFKGLGSKKLALLEHFTTKPSVLDILQIEGFAEISAQSYIDGYDKFFEFIKDIPVTIKQKIESVSVDGDLNGMTFVFTGVRRSDLEKTIESRGGKIGSGVTKNTTHLVVREIGSGSSKEKKAIEFGVEILTVEQLENLLNK